MSDRRIPSARWITVAIATAALAYGIPPSNAQPTAAQAAAEGRTAISGAQGGPGGQPGLAQGGLGMQGSSSAQIEVPLRRPGKVVRAEDVKPAERTAGLGVIGPATPDRTEPLPKKSDDVKSLNGTPRKTERALQRSRERARHGVSGIDSVN